jgi:sortase (surface protein transpeptidase)
VGTVPAGLGALSDAPAAEPPVALRVPAIDVDAVVRPVGVEADGSMTVPPADEVGWYRFGPAPGEPGTAVLAAHVDFDGRPGAFFRLRDLAVGDEVVVATADGGRSAYAVVAVERVPKDELAATPTFARDGPPRLALVTCGGAFDRSARSYVDNVVAYAEPVAAVTG